MPTINIVLCTLDGGAFIDAQLQSFLDQDHENWRLWVSDDGSVDDTRAKVKSFARTHPNREVRLLEGARCGVAANYLSVLSRKELAGSWVSFADQDDVWMPHKLSRAVSQVMELGSSGGHGVYASRTVLTRSDLSVLGQSPRHKRSFRFGNALVQNVLGGNTIVMPPAMTDMLRETLPAAQSAAIPFHDWWIYMLATGVGASVINDIKASVFYRQHSKNVLGTNVRNPVARLYKVTDRTYAGWIDRNIKALCSVKQDLTDENQNLLETFRTWRASPLARRVNSPLALGLYRQTCAGNLALRVLARTGRL